MVGYKGNIEALTRANTYFRQVLFTGAHMQLVLMSLKPMEDIGLEVHTSVDQFFRVEMGEGNVIMGSDEYHVADGDVFIVPAGTQHNVVNTSAVDDLKLYTIYAPPNHKDGTIHKTKAEAEAAEHH